VVAVIVGLRKTNSVVAVIVRSKDSVVAVSVRSKDSVVAVSVRLFERQRGCCDCSKDDCFVEATQTWFLVSLTWFLV
jgi:hypothetical protein